MNGGLRAAGTADSDLGRGQYRLRQESETDRATDLNRLAEPCRRQRFDRCAIANPVEVLRHLPDGNQSDNEDGRNCQQPCARASHVQAAVP